MLLTYVIMSYLIAVSTAFSFSRNIRSKVHVKCQPTQLHMTSLTTGELKQVQFSQIQSLSNDLGKFRLDATIKSSEMKQYFNEYMEEMKRKKVLFPGFRPGKLPPHAMPDVRKYLVGFGLENIIGRICNINGLELCSETRDEVPFGDDEYYEQIIIPDARGFDFAQQRNTWREGSDLTFVAEFYALIDSSEEEEAGTTTAAPVDLSSRMVDAIDVETVDVIEVDTELRATVAAEE